MGKTVPVVVHFTQPFSVVRLMTHRPMTFTLCLAVAVPFDMVFPAQPYYSFRIPIIRMVPFAYITATINRTRLGFSKNVGRSVLGRHLVFVFDLIPLAAIPALF